MCILDTRQQESCKRGQSQRGPLGDNHPPIMITHVGEEDHLAPVPGPAVVDTQHDEPQTAPSPRQSGGGGGEGGVRTKVCGCAWKDHEKSPSSLCRPTGVVSFPPFTHIHFLFLVTFSDHYI